ncbi:hypothetical protein CFP65_7554 [Kitasatospora sp. MMS16-BH015]|uniref:hypothetical protein n=1 Tax=Kitasatospora sp. MMS16-BH015 TaxID=2018025 RepID=UPI000CA3440F|nr:hypothetical protein [Kitasatospora sp. MMS16-BH015]AUG82126.1 hypothetical protein CFP65_7554 [Kitasatospora sp. MMS16-BH015]
MRRDPHRRSLPRLAALALLTAAVGCSAAPAPRRAAAPPMPQTLAAEAVATQEFGLLAGGGWAAAWNLWPTTAQQAFSQAEFIRLNTECRPLLGLPYVIDQTAKLDPDTVRVDWHRADTTGSNTVVHQDGRWHFTPDPATLTSYRLGVDQLISQRRAAGSCH